MIFDTTLELARNRPANLFAAGILYRRP